MTNNLSNFSNNLSIVDKKHSNDKSTSVDVRNSL